MLRLILRADRSTDGDRAAPDIAGVYAGADDSLTDQSASTVSAAYDF